jgi:ribosomal protein S11
MMARNRRYRKNRTAALGVATAALLGGGAIAVAALAPGSHSAGLVAAPAAHTARVASQGTMLSAALADWNSSEQGSYAQLAQMTSARGFSQTSHRGKTLDIQRGIVVLATNQFVILQSANGSLHLWLVSGGTKFQNVSGTTAGTAALTASTSATQQAMQSGNMIPATTLLAGSPTTAAAMLTPTAEPQTVTVQVAGTDLTVTVTVTRSTAAVTQTATTPANAKPAPMTSTFAMNAWQPANSLARGDLAVIVGTRSHQTLHAQLVLFSPLTTSVVGGTTGSGLTKLAAKPSPAPTHW